MFLRLNYLRKMSLATISLCAAINNSCIAMDPPNTEVDIAIIGGGMAGLTTAYHLNKSGLSCSLFEAKDDVGGRTKTHYFKEGEYYELGGTQIDSDHDSAIALAKELGIELNKVCYGEGKFSVYANGKAIPDRELIKILEESKKVFGQFKDYQQDRDLIFDDAAKSWKFQNILAAINQLSSPEAKGFWEAFIKDECGIELDQLPITSASWLYEEASNYYKLLSARMSPGGSFTLTAAAQANVEGTYSYRVKGGMSTLANALKDACQKTVFECNRVLTSLSKDESGYHLVFDNKTVIAKNVIMTIPFSVLRDIEFGENIALSDHHKNAIQNLNYGTVSKVGVSITGKFDILGHFNIDQNQQFYCWPGHSAITIIVGGESGKDLTESTAEILQEKAINGLSQAYPALGKIKESHMKNWAEDPFAKGSWSTSSTTLNYSNEPSKLFPQLCAYAEPIHENTFVFAGEHTIFGEGRAHIEGAIQSGEIAARIILSNKNMAQNPKKENCSIQ